ncbi:MAG: hypothetical protein K6A32_07650 [Bacteroidales bacterium]|nr:hypothetical protein [Bacteroidales bacterium]
MKRFLYRLALAAVALCVAACKGLPTSVPATFSELTDTAEIYPDYRDITIPPNIAPLNFMVYDAGAKAFVVEWTFVDKAGRKGASEDHATPATLVCGAADDGKIEMDTTAWRNLLTSARGKALRVCVYAERPNGWVRFAPFSVQVAEEEIDAYLSYRLIEPGYELYRQIGLYQRNVTNFDEAVIYENNRSFDNDNNHCVNCHNYQAYGTDRMLFHVRASHGGTIVTHGSEAHKIAIRHDSILGAGVYPSWHPTLPLVAFSTNKTGQVFHMLHPEKIEVLDEASDLLLYDAEANTVSNVIRTTDALETFPCWTPDGRRLYYCSADMPALPGEYSPEQLAIRYDSLLYNLYSMSFDPATRTFGEPRLEVDAASQHKSVSVPRVSPDGRYVLFTLGDYGQFHIWHKSADLWVKEVHGDGELSAEAVTAGLPESGAVQVATTDNRTASPADTGTNSAALPSPQFPQCRPLAEANAVNQPDSYHSWSSNGRWIAFASRRDDGSFSRAYISYFDRSGRAHRAFLLPQRDPEYNLLLLKSFNVPEMTRTPVQVSREQFEHVVLHTEAEVAKYK